MVFDRHGVAHALGAGSLMGVLGPGGPGGVVLASWPPELRSALWGAIGAALSLVLMRGAAAVGDVLSAAGRRYARRLDPQGAQVADDKAAGEKPAEKAGT